MKFSIIFGAFPNEGGISCNGISVGEIDLTSVEGVPQTLGHINMMMKIYLIIMVLNTMITLILKH